MKKFFNSIFVVVAFIATFFYGLTASAQCMFSNFTASPSVITEGDSCILSWNTTGNCNSYLVNGIHVIGNSIVVHPITTTTYNVSEYGNNFLNGQTVIVIVNQNNPPCMISNITATPSTIVVGNPTTITWTLNSACNSNFTWDVNGIPVSGTSYTAYPTATTTYIVTGHSTKATTSQSVEVIVEKNAYVIANTSPDTICGNSKHQQLVTVAMSSYSGSGGYIIYSLFISESGTSCLSNIKMEKDLVGTQIGSTLATLPSAMNPYFLILPGTTQRLNFYANVGSCYGSVKVKIDSMLVKVLPTGKFEMWRQPLSSPAIAITDCSSISATKNASYADQIIHKGNLANVKIGSFKVINSLLNRGKIIEGIDIVKNEVKIPISNIRLEGGGLVLDIVFKFTDNIVKFNTYLPSSSGDTITFDVFADLGNSDSLKSSDFLQLKVIAVNYKDVPTGTQLSLDTDVFIQKITYMSLNGINKIESKKTYFTIYPNPVTNLLKIETTSTEEVLIFNSIGQIVLKSIIHEIDVSHLPAGFYFLKMGMETKQFIVKRY